MAPSNNFMSSGTKRRKRRSKHSEDPERRRLEEAQDGASPAVFLPRLGNNGVGKFALSDANARALCGLHHLVLARTGGGATWGEGGDRDPRRRVYGFLPGRRADLLAAGVRIQRYGAGGAREHDDALRTASVDVAFGGDRDVDPAVLALDGCVRSALEAVTERVRSLVPDQYKGFAAMNRLIAVQPNLHNGAGYLPAHLDFPRNDGFGVLIVTICVRGRGTIVLIDEGGEGEYARSWRFSLDEGEAYILSGDARNKCVHGVLCEDEPCHRETLNLRYGLHSEQFAYEEIDQHWPD